MKALTLWQPWATAIIHGPKRTENRPWKTSAILGQHFLIHAGKTFDKDGAESIRSLWPAMPADVPQGAIIGAARLIGVLKAKTVKQRISDPQAEIFQAKKSTRVSLCLYHKDHAEAAQAAEAKANEGGKGEGDPWFFGPYGWILDSVQALPSPVPCKGAQTLWTPPPAELAQCLEQLEGLGL